MTNEELIAQLRNSKGWPTLGNAAADRIESLTEENEALTAEVARLGTQCEGLAQSAINNGQALIIAEAKLNKTVSALREIAAQTKDVTPELLNLYIAIHSVHRCANDILKEHL